MGTEPKDSMSSEFENLPGGISASSASSSQPETQPVLFDNCINVREPIIIDQSLQSRKRPKSRENSPKQFSKKQANVSQCLSITIQSNHESAKVIHQELINENADINYQIFRSAKVLPDSSRDE